MEFSRYMKAKICLLLSLLVLSSCSCKNTAVKIVEPMNTKTDPFLSCSQLKFAIAEAEYLLRAAERKEPVTEAYAGSPLCLISTQFDIIKAEEAAKDRLDYLLTIQNEKRCLDTKVQANKVEDKTAVKLPIEKK